MGEKDMLSGVEIAQKEYPMHTHREVKAQDISLTFKKFMQTQNLIIIQVRFGEI